MTREMLPYLGLAIFSVFIASLSQTLLKWEAGKEHTSLAREYLNVGVIGGYGLLALSMLLTMFAYKKLPLSMTPAFECLKWKVKCRSGFAAMNTVRFTDACHPERKRRTTRF